MSGIEKGISPAIATILLIALTVVAVGSIAAFLGLLSPGKPPVAVTVTIQGWDSTSVNFFHGGGDNVNKTDLVFYRNDVSSGVGSGIWSAGTTMAVTGLSGVTAGDNVRLVYAPAGQVLVSETL